MDFSDINFLCRFLPLFLTAYYICPQKYRNFALFAGSLIFCGMGGWRGAALPVCSAAVNFILVRLMCTGGRKKMSRQRLPWLVTALLYNILVLGYYKFMGSSLPPGISYYIFALISYDLDVFWNREQTAGGWLEVAAFAVMFPKFPAGPIVRYRDLAGQLRGRKVRARSVEYGLSLVIVGLAFKVLLADRLGILWHDIQTAGAESISTPMAWMGMAGYCAQLLLDFRGYSLMARGLAAMLGFDFPRNFDHPYGALSISEYYRRWHMSLGNWFREYLYIPLGGNRRGAVRAGLNLMAVWIVTGIWHGVTANFLMWGAVLGMLVVTEKFWTGNFLKRHSLFAHCYVWFLIPLTWMIFAIPDPGNLGNYFVRLFPFLSLWSWGQNGAESAGIIGGVRDWTEGIRTYFPVFLAAFAVSGRAAERLWKKYWDKIIVKAGLFVVFWICIRRIGQAAHNPFMYFGF